MGESMSMRPVKRYSDGPTSQYNYQNQYGFYDKRDPSYNNPPLPQPYQSPAQPSPYPNSSYPPPPPPPPPPPYSDPYNSRQPLPQQSERQIYSRYFILNEMLYI